LAPRRSNRKDEPFRVIPGFARVEKEIVYQGKRCDLSGRKKEAV
jgi:hypothetical protein